MDKIEASRNLAAQLHDRLDRKSVAVRSSFISSMDPETLPPLTSLIRGGRGGEVKLKLLLSMLWVAVKEPYDVSQSARVWAELIGLEDPEGKGAARVNAAVRRLTEAGYLHAEKSPGLPHRLYLQEETGARKPYTHPGAYWEKGRRSPDSPRYTQIPVELWLNGWIAKLTAPGLSMLLILLEQARGKNFAGIWFSPSVAAKRYGLSEVTRRKGWEELQSLGIISVGQAPVGRGTLNTTRRRNTYTVIMERINIPVGEPSRKRPVRLRPAPPATPDVN